MLLSSPKLKRYLLIFLLCFAGTFQVFAQNSDYSVKVAGGVGGVLKIYPEFPELGVLSSFSLEVGRTVREKNWASLHEGMETSFVLSHYRLGNDQVLGNAWVLGHGVKFPKTINDRWTFAPGLTLGGAYFNSPYHYLDNPSNVTISTRFAFWVSANADLSYQIKDNLYIGLSASFQHASNGHTQLPNVGLNIPLLELSLEKRFTTFNVKEHGQEGTFTKGKWGIMTGVSTGTYKLGETTRPDNSASYRISMITLSAKRRITPIRNSMYGVDVTYNAGYRALFYLTEQNKDDFIRASSVVIFGAREYVMNHFSLLIQAGINVYNPGLRYWLKEYGEPGVMNTIKAFIPGKFGVQYYLIKPTVEPKWNVFAGIHVKSNLLQADFLQLGIGIQYH